MAESEHILAARGLHKSFGRGPGRVHVLRGLELRVRRGEFLAVMGPSGCGKSTLLHLLGLMASADAGEVLIDGRATSQLAEAARARIRRERIGFVFQRFNLLSVLGGFDNIMLSLRIRGRCDARRVRQLLEYMGVAELAGRKPAEMSIGQQQRIAVARAIAGRPDLLLADEPAGSLDSDNRAALLALLGRINRENGQTIVMITHSASVSATAERTVYIKDGRILDGKD